MIQKKVCLIGTSAVGKTSLIARFVSSIFQDKYLTTVGVKIDKKNVVVEGREMTLVIWDLAGDDDFQRLNLSYLRGSGGLLFVADGTRQITLDQVLEIQSRVVGAVGSLPCLLALNKADLKACWEIADEKITDLRAAGWRVLSTSAKLGTGVEEAFGELGRLMLPPIT
ncbi:MAG: GTP-binding protein [Verrucomicrobia bacterium]|nr:GTP-binding protein [Verrucomicrobiota bacterium]